MVKTGLPVNAKFSNYGHEVTLQNEIISTFVGLLDVHIFLKISCDNFRLTFILGLHKKYHQNEYYMLFCELKAALFTLFSSVNSYYEVGRQYRAYIENNVTKMGLHVFIHIYLQKHSKK